MRIDKMDGIQFPDKNEMSYRNTHYKKGIHQVLESTIWCTICNLDLTENIILSHDIMIHNIFLCLCCKNCFENLSDSPNVCILCTSNIKLRHCQKCSSKLCMRCIIQHYPGHIKSKQSLKNCLGCTPSVLWSLRSQAAAVLKCFSFELENRLLINGQESEEKQNLREFIINDAKFNSKSTKEFVHKIRIKYLFDMFDSTIKPLFEGYQKLKAKQIETNVTNFGQLCEYVIGGICSVVKRFEHFFNNKDIESFDIKVKTLLKTGILFGQTETHTNTIPNCHVVIENSLSPEKVASLIKRKEKMNIIDENIDWYTDITSDETQSNCSTKNSDFKYQTNSKTSKQNVISQEPLKLREINIQLEILDETMLKNLLGKNYKEKLKGKMISPKTETNIERRRRRNYSNHDKKNHNDLEKELIVNTTTLDKCTDIKTASIKKIIKKTPIINKSNKKKSKIYNLISGDSDDDEIINKNRNCHSQKSNRDSDELFIPFTPNYKSPYIEILSSSDDELFYNNSFINHIHPSRESTHRKCKRKLYLDREKSLRKSKRLKF